MKAARRIEPSYEALAARLAEAREENERLRRENERLAHERAASKAAEEEAQAELGAFFALIAHQLKSPLLPLEVSLMTIARAIERGTSVPPDTFPRTMRQARRLGRLIDSLLVDLPRIEDGSLRVAALSFDLRDPVRRAVGEAKLMLESRTFTLHEPASPMLVRGDPERVEQIVASLIENAVKYSPPEAPIGVRVIAEDPANATVLVEDQGIGIPARELGQVFTKFYRGSNAPSYLYRGLGVGLYLAFHLASLCRGRLSVESVEGQGTICRLRIPLDA
jgi:two-component system, sensor histidine kinase